MVYSKLSGFSDEIDSSTELQFQVLKKLGISYFEPRGIDGKNISLLSDEEVLALKAKMTQYGIEASSIGSPIGKVNLEDDFENHFILFQRVVKIAKMLGSKYIRIFSFYHHGGQDWVDEERAEVLTRLSRMIVYAKEQDVVLLHENEKDIYGDTAIRCADLMKELYCDSFKAVFDLANFVQCGQNTKYAYELLQEYVEYIHIKDARFENGGVVPAGNGDGNVEYILNQLFARGYDGYLSLEPHLGSFEGLEALELGDEMLKLPQGGEGTFTLAYLALKKILEKIC